MAETYTYPTPPVPFLPHVLVRGSDNAWIPLDLGNMDYQAFLTWLTEPGNTAPEGWTGPQNPPG